MGDKTRRYEGLYRMAAYERADGAYAWPRCVYCGQAAETTDHCPPMNMIEAYRESAPYREQYLRVKSCVPCKRMLKDTLQPDIFQRIAYLKSRLSKSGKREFVSDLWAESDIDELGKNLQSLINSEKFKTDKLRLRIAYVGGIQAIRQMLRDDF